MPGKMFSNIPVSVDTSSPAAIPPSQLSQAKVSPNLVWWPLGRSMTALSSPSEPAGRQRKMGAWSTAWSVYFLPFLPIFYEL